MRLGGLVTRGPLHRKGVIAVSLQSLALYVMAMVLDTSSVHTARGSSVPRETSTSAAAR